MIANMLATTGFVVTNKVLVRAIGIRGAALLGELCSEYLYWKERDGLNDGWFFSTVENLEREIGMSASTQTRVLSELKGMGLLDFKKVGIPAKRHIRLDFEAIERVMDNPSQPKMNRPVSPERADSQPKMSSQSAQNGPECQPKMGQYNNNKNKNSLIIINNNNTTNEFSPTLDEIVELCEKQKLSGMSDSPKAFAEWFHSVLAEDEGFVNYKGRRIKNWASLVSVIRSVDISGRSIKNAKTAYKRRVDEDYF